MRPGTKAWILSLLLHLTAIALVAWLLTRVATPVQAVNRGRITLDLAMIQTPPAAVPHYRPTPPAPPAPPRKKPLPPKPPQKPEKKAPAPKASPKLPTPKPRQTPAPKAKSTPAPKAPAKGQTRQAKPKVSKSAAKTPTAKTRPKSATPAKKPASKVTKKPSPRRRATPKPRPITPKGADKKLISSLYGSSYARMNSAQRRFIDENLRTILMISQRTLNYLGYPRDAARFGEQGTNIVEFWLHPNGDISGLRLRRRLPSASLNRQTLEVIKTAYMHYPRPKVKTKIIIYVRYRLY